MEATSPGFSGPAAPRAARIYAEQVRQLYAAVPSATAANLVCALFLAFIQRAQEPSWVTAVWLGYFLLAVLARAGLAQMFRRHAPAPADMRRWGHWYLVCMALTGVGWGTAGILFLTSGEAAHQLITGFILIGMAAGAMTSLSAVLPVYLVYVAPTMIPGIVQFLLAGDEVGIVTGMLATVLLAFLLTSAWRLNRSLVTSLSLRFENQELAERLKGEKETTDALNAELTQEVVVRERAETDLVQAKEAAERANRAKSEFLSSMSHELRTPMNAIMGFGQLLGSDPDNPLGPSQKDCCEQILGAGDHLLELIDEVLDLAKIESGGITLAFEAVDPREVVDTCVTLTQTMADARDITLTNTGRTDDLPSIRTDPTRLRQVLLNLLSNAVKYNRPGGDVRVNLDMAGPSMLKITVADTGSGIPEERRHEVFRPFSRLGLENSAVQGTGIGLAITKELVELMGGEIGFTSELGAGTAFWATFPVDPARRGTASRGPVAPVDSAAPASESAPWTVAGRRPLVLYIEDNTANLHLVEKVIERHGGFDLISATDAESGIEMARTRQPDVILMDIGLPGMDGFEALKVLQESAETKAIPVIALSANAIPRDIQRGHTAGFVDYLTKPMRIKTVTDVLTRAIDESRR